MVVWSALHAVQVSAVCSLERQPGSKPKDISCTEAMGSHAPTPQEVKPGKCTSFSELGTFHLRRATIPCP